MGKHILDGMPEFLLVRLLLGRHVVEGMLEFFRVEAVAGCFGCGICTCDIEVSVSMRCDVLQCSVFRCNATQRVNEQQVGRSVTREYYCLRDVSMEEFGISATMSRSKTKRLVVGG